MKSAWAGWNRFFSTLPARTPPRTTRSFAVFSVSLPGAGSSSHSPAPASGRDASAGK